MRLSVFTEDIEDALISQTAAVTPGSTTLVRLRPERRQGPLARRRGRGRSARRARPGPGPQRQRHLGRSEIARGRGLPRRGRQADPAGPALALDGRRDLARHRRLTLSTRRALLRAGPTARSITPTRWPHLPGLRGLFRRRRAGDATGSTAIGRPRSASITSTTATTSSSIPSRSARCSRSSAMSTRGRPHEDASRSLRARPRHRRIGRAGRPAAKRLRRLEPAGRGRRPTACGYMRRRQHTARRRRPGAGRKPAGGEGRDALLQHGRRGHEHEDGGPRVRPGGRQGDLRARAATT